MNSRLKQFIITVLFCFAFCIILGFIFFLEFIFDLHTPRFIFIYLGSAGALIYSALKYRSIRDSIVYALCVLIFNIILYKASPFIFVVRDTAIIAFVWLGIYLYKIRFEKKMEAFQFFRAFALGVILAVALCVAGLILVLINVKFSNLSARLVLQISYLYLQSGMLIGLGIGLGSDTANYFISRKRKEILG